MKVKMILPALSEARDPDWRSIKYSLFPPLGFATLAAYLSDEDEVTLQDEHVEELDLNDEPDLVVLQVYITSAYRAYEIADHYRDLGAMVNGSFVFGMDRDDEAVFDRTVDWALEQGIETATFHLLTPYPGTATHRRLAAQGRVTSADWDLYDTRHAVYRPAGMPASALEAGYRRAYQRFYRWESILRSAWSRDGWSERLRHVAYVGAWRKLDPWWDLVIQARQVGKLVPVLETLLGGAGRRQSMGSGPAWNRGSPRERHGYRLAKPAERQAR